MKKTFAMFVVLLFAVGCQNAKKADSEPENDIVSVEPEVVDSVKVDSVSLTPVVGTEVWADTVQVPVQ